MSQVLISGGQLFDPSRGSGEPTDLLLGGGHVLARGAALQASGARVLDASGKWVLPGFVDLRARLRDERDVDQALAAGFTTVLSSPETPPLPTARLTCLGAAPLTRNLEGDELGEVPDGVRCLSQGFQPMPRAGVLRRALQYLRPFELLVMVHAEDASLTGKGVLGESAVATRLGLSGVPTTAEAAIVARDLEVLAGVGGRLHFSHLTCGRSVALLRGAKQRGLRVTADVTPHHLTLDVRAAEGFSLAARVWPPLRELEDVFALREGVADGTIDAIASDHHRVDGLDREHPFEQCAPGAESYLTLVARVLSLGLSAERVAAALSSAPAGLLGLKSGRLSVGDAADVVIIDPVARAVEATIVAGELRYMKEGSR